MNDLLLEFAVLVSGAAKASVYNYFVYELLLEFAALGLKLPKLVTRMKNLNKIII